MLRNCGFIPRSFMLYQAYQQLGLVAAPYPHIWPQLTINTGGVSLYWMLYEAGRRALPNTGIKRYAQECRP